MGEHGEQLAALREGAAVLLAPEDQDIANALHDAADRMWLCTPRGRPRPLLRGEPGVAVEADGQRQGGVLPLGGDVMDLERSDAPADGAAAAWMGGIRTIGAQDVAVDEAQRRLVILFALLAARVLGQGAP